MIYIYIVCCGPKCARRITWPNTRMLKVSLGRLKQTCDTRVIHYNYYARVALESNLRLEKVVASKQLRLAMETEDERRARLENDAATKRLRLVMETEEERKARLVKMVATTQLRLALEAEDESAKKWIGFVFDLYLIWIDIGVFKNFKECARSPCNGNHFSSF